jgi:hypothetical protein
VSRLKRSGGFSLVEAILASVFIIPLGMLMMRLQISMGKVPARLSESVQMRTVHQVADLIVRDLREAEPSRFDTSLLRPNGGDPKTFSFIVARANPANIGNPTRITVRYRWQPDAVHPPGVLIRDENGARPQTLLQYMPAPTNVEPFLEQDMTAQAIVMVTMRQNSPGMKHYWTVRRVAIKGL